MSISMYQASVPRFVNILGNLSNILDKAQAHVDAKKLDTATLTTYRLFPDMLPMTKQVQIACDAAKGVVARLAGVDIPAYEDNENTLAELKARIAKTIAFVESVEREAVEADETRTIELKFPNGSMNFTARDFVFNFSLPNFLFHVVTAYGLLRAEGVPLGKMDYLAGAL